MKKPILRSILAMAVAGSFCAGMFPGKYTIILRKMYRQTIKIFTYHIISDNIIVGVERSYGSIYESEYHFARIM